MLQGDVLPTARELAFSGEGLGCSEEGQIFKPLRSRHPRHTVSAGGKKELPS